MLQKNQELNQTYLILEEIGSGGGGTVYKAYHKNLEKTVVLKKIHANLLKSNIRAEVDILKNLKSPYLPQVLDFIQQGDDVYTVMDYIPGKSLKEVLEEGGSFPQKRVLKWLDQLCQAVEQLHMQERPIIHGDIKPANIMLTPKDDICLIDFNISGDFQESDIIGFTQGYAAPEQISSVKRRIEKIKGKSTAPSWKETEAEEVPREKGAKAGEPLPYGGAGQEESLPETRETVTLERPWDADLTELEEPVPGETTVPEEPLPYGRTGQEESVPEGGETKIHVDTRSDIYSIGATVYHLMTGQKPDPENVRPIEELTDQIEDSFAYLIMKCLERDPDKRFQTIQELHKAVLNVHKSGKEYRRLLRTQVILRLLLIAGIIGCLGLAGSGWVLMGKERTAKYEEYLALMDEARQRQEYGQIEEYYLQASALYPDRGGAALKKTEALYQQRKYSDIIDFVDSSVENTVTEEQELGEIYSLYGSSYLELEEYDKAEDAFQKAISYGARNSQLYCDYAVALARMGRIEEAEEKLEQAVGYQLATDGIYYVQGEILYSREDWTEAAESFRSCIESTQDDYMKMRAYLMCDRALGQGAGTLDDRRAMLEEARDAVPLEYQNAILEELAQVYMNLSEESGDPQYDLDAIEVLKEIIQNGWGIYLTYNNIAVLYQKNQMYSEENEILRTMLEIFGEEYNTYKRLAFMEAASQLQLEQENRSFEKFLQYYKKAFELYEEQLSGNQTDLEMASLEDLYRQAADGGWIAED